MLLCAASMPARGLDAPYKVAVHNVVNPKADNDIVREWKKIQRQLTLEAEIIEKCISNHASCSTEAEALAAIVERARQVAYLQKIPIVHAAVNNAITYATDWNQWHEYERWSGPVETFRTGKGDCEDCALAHYVLLLLSGVTPRDMRLLVESHQDFRDNLYYAQAHVVLFVRVGEHWRVLECGERRMPTAAQRKNKFIRPNYVLDWEETPYPLARRLEATAR